MPAVPVSPPSSAFSCANSWWSSATVTRTPFDREKLKLSVTIACRKRGVEEERIERIVNGIVRELEISGETEIDTKRLGRLAMERLAELDEVAYVRFASVYEDFSGARDFERFIARLSDQREEDAAE